MRRPAIQTKAVPFAAILAMGLLLLAPYAHALALLVPTDTRYGALELESQVMDVKIDNQTAQTHITQVFHNRYGSQIEATYLMPIPKGAHVTDFAMEMNGKKVRGEVLEKEKARKIYTDIVRRMRDPGLLEYVDQEIFRARVFPIPPNGHQKVELTVTHMLPQENGIVEYEWPFEAPKAVQQRGRPTSPEEFDVKLDIKSKVAIKSVYSPTHKVRVKRKDDNHTVVKLDEVPKADQPIFRCYYTLSNKGVGLHVLTTREEDHDGTFLLMISPGEFYNKENPPPVDFTFVLDTSGSMGHDDKIGAAKKALEQCLNALRPKDRFNIIRFSTEVEPFEEKFLAANEKNLERAKKFIKELRVTGGTNIDGALEEALKHKPREGRLHTVLFITDGKPTIGERNIDTILKNVDKRNERGLRVFACGVGYDVNARLLDRLADGTRSVAEYIRPKEDIEVAISNLFDKVSKPVLTDLDLDFGDLKVRDVYPKKLPDLFAGTQLTVFGRYENGGDRAIELTGKVGDKKKTFTYEETFLKKSHDKHAFIKTLWVTRRIAYLLDEIRKSGESDELRDEVVRLAKKYGIVTPYTSYLVQEDETERRRNVATLRRRPVQLGVSAEAETGALVIDGIARNAGPVPTLAPSGGAAGSGLAMGRTEESRSREDILAETERSGTGAFGGDRILAFAPSRPSGTAGAKSAPAAEPSLFLSYSARPDAPATGKEAVELSKALRDMKDVSLVGQSRSVAVASRKVVDGRSFQLTGGVWKEALETRQQSNQNKKPRKTLKIKYLSDAYFEFVKLRPDLKKLLALGEKVEFDVNDLHIVIGPEGKEKLTKTDLDALAKKKK